MPEPEPAGSVTDGRYLSLVRELGAVTEADCNPGCDPAQHRMEAARHINAFLQNPELLWKLRTVANGAAPRIHENLLRPQSSAASSDS